MPLNIEDYAIIGDCETAALVGRDLSIDWICWPRFDSSACFANLLGTKDNGRWSIEPADPGAKMTRNYRGHSLILETTIETTDGVAVVIDFMPTRMPGSHLIRRVRGVRAASHFVPSLSCASVMARSCHRCAAATTEVKRFVDGRNQWEGLSINIITLRASLWMFIRSTSGTLKLCNLSFPGPNRCGQ
jgi:GH15 family glucan-1,4-alpha-glucosidase